MGYVAIIISIFGSLASIVTIVIGVYNIVHLIHTHNDPKQVKKILGITSGIAGFFILSTLIIALVVANPNNQSTITAKSKAATETCPNTNGVSLYVDPEYKGHCHTFPPGMYDLSQFGLDQNVSSLRDPGGKYHITLRDKSNRPGYFDKDEPLLPIDWADQAHTLLVELH